MQIKFSLLALLLLSAFVVFSQNKSYLKSVKIGNQIWMQENLDVDRFRNGDIILGVFSREDWNNAHKEYKPVWCYYEYKTTNGLKYGKLYNYWAIKDKRGLAPEGWYIPTEQDWQELEIYLQTDVGKKLKSTTGWNLYTIGGPKVIPCSNCFSWNNEYRRKVACHVCKDSRFITIMTPEKKISGNGNNISGFFGLPGGLYNKDGLGFEGIGRFSGWWSISAFGKSFYLWSEHSDLSSLSNKVGDGFYIRCIKEKKVEQVQILNEKIHQ